MLFVNMLKCNTVMLGFQFFSFFDGSDEAHVTTRGYVTVPRMVTLCNKDNVAIRGTLCNNIVTYRSANGNDM
jgi:hypothetical protein